jgi:hypothetical protein
MGRGGIGKTLSKPASYLPTFFHRSIDVRTNSREPRLRKRAGRAPLGASMWLANFFSPVDKCENLLSSRPGSDGQ